MSIKMFKVAGNLAWGEWIRGILGALISGGAGAVAAGFSVSIMDPKDWGTSDPAHLLELMGVCFLFSGIISLMKFLQIHPVPDQLQAALASAAGNIEAAKQDVLAAQHNVEPKP